MAKLLTIGKTSADNSGIPPKDEEVSVMESILKLYSNLSIEGKDYIKVRLEMIGELDVSK